MKMLFEGRHKQGCTCGFCKNKGSFKSKAKVKDDDSSKPATDTEESKPWETNETKAGRIVSGLLEDNL